MCGASLPEVKDRLLESAQRELIARLALEMAPKATVVHVKPMTRFGFSAAKLCIAHFDEAGVGRPFVVKVDGVDDFELERTAAADLLAFFADADVHSCGHGGYGAIAYPLVQSSSGEIETFEDALGSSVRDEERLRDALERVFDRCFESAHAAPTVETRSFGDEYRRHHASGATDDALRKALGGTYSDIPFDFLGEVIVDPRAVKERLASTEREMTVGPIHGDLHGSNIVFDRDGHPHLIDFAWGDRSGHLMKDFVLMESSLRFFAFSRYFDAALQARTDGALLEENGPELVRALAEGSALESDYSCLATMIEITRNAARGAVGDAYFEEYLQAQFMFLYRLLQYPNYPFHTTLRALGALGARVLDAF
jgi:hypothetical protein